MLWVRPWGTQDSHRTLPEKPWHPNTTQYPQALRGHASPIPTPGTRPSSPAAPAHSRCYISGRPLPRTSCALSKEQEFGEHQVSVEARRWGGHWGRGLLRAGAEGGTHHSHLLLEVVQVPAVFGALGLLGRALVIFLVLRGGDTIAVRTTRLRARRGYRGAPAKRLCSCVSGQGLLWGLRLSLPCGLGVSQNSRGLSPPIASKPPTPHAHLWLLGSLCQRVSSGSVYASVPLSVSRSLPFSLHVSFFPLGVSFCLLLPLPGLAQAPTPQVSVACCVYWSDPLDPPPRVSVCAVLFPFVSVSCCLFASPPPHLRLSPSLCSAFSDLTLSVSASLRVSL